MVIAFITFFVIGLLAYIAKYLVNKYDDRRFTKIGYYYIAAFVYWACVFAMWVLIIISLITLAIE